MEYTNEQIEIDLAELISFFLKKLWIVIGVGIIFAFLFYGLFKMRHIELYNSTCSIIIINQKEENNDDKQVVLSASLTDDYVEIIRSRRLVNEMIEELSLNMSYEQIVDNIKVIALEGTRIIEISVTHTEPTLSQKIADKMQELAVVHIKDMLEVYAVKELNVAEIPTVSIGSNPMKYIIVGAFLGIFLASFGLLVIYLADGTIKNREHVRRYLKLNTLGMILDDEKQNDIEALRTNVKFAKDILKTIAVIQCDSNFSDDYTAYELAHSFAKSNNKTLYIDADFRNRLNTSMIKKRELDCGLVDYLTTNMPIDDICNKLENDNLIWISAGTDTDKPSEILDSRRFVEFMQEAKNKYDIVIINTSPLDVYIDAAIIAKQCDGAIVVIESGVTHYKVVQKAIEQLSSLKTNILGCVIKKSIRIK